MNLVETSFTFLICIILPSFCARKKNCNLFTHEVPKSSRSSFKGVRAFRVELEFENVGFARGMKKMFDCSQSNSPQNKGYFLHFSGERKQARGERGARVTHDGRGQRHSRSARKNK